MKSYYVNARGWEMKAWIIGVVFLMVAGNGAMADEYRTFTDKDGREIRAKVVECNTRSGKVTLLRDNGNKATVPASVFVDSDVEYIKQWVSASQFQISSKFKIKTDIEKKSNSDGPTSVTFSIELANNTNMDIDDVRVEYAAFVRVAGFNGEPDSEKVYTGTLDFQSMGVGQKRMMNTASYELKSTSKSYQYEDTYSDGIGTYTVTRTGYKKTTEDKIAGIWLRVYGPKVGDEQISRDVTDKRGLEEKYTWPASEFK
jgi:hypothetical protein